eukprot:GHRQ01039565.1.p2 GENE.GHRQ01039565.1~~GHRQ01039565.1.p2  ORF type:complete len:127 (+),score=17.06 GHRQ01039565.1:58-381(+)
MRQQQAVVGLLHCQGMSARVVMCTRLSSTKPAVTLPVASLQQLSARSPAQLMQTMLSAAHVLELDMLFASVSSHQLAWHPPAEHIKTMLNTLEHVHCPSCLCSSAPA